MLHFEPFKSFLWRVQSHKHLPFSFFGEQTCGNEMLLCARSSTTCLQQAMTSLMEISKLVSLLAIAMDSQDIAALSFIAISSPICC
jgi:hypothetical protein